MTKAGLLATLIVALAVLAACAAPVRVQPPHVEQAAGAYEPIPGQPGKDVVWFPSPPATVEKMLDMAGVTASDYVIDLGSGDGRNVIAAAKRGARGLGVEYDPDMVALSRRKAAAEGVSANAQFVQGDMYEADISGATVLALFLIPENLRKLTPKFMQLPGGTRIVSNAFEIPGWQAAQTGTAGGDCTVWCTVYLYIVPANVQGRWRLPAGELSFEQDFEGFTGKLTTVGGAQMPIVDGRVKGERIRFFVGLDEYVGRLRGETMSGTVAGSMSGPWRAVRAK
jgi:SAM-dependent methyltransferase